MSVELFIGRWLFTNVFYCSEALAPEEQNVYSPARLVSPAPSGAECSLDWQKLHGAPLERCSHNAARL